jgi:hypothetical protein
MEILLQLTNSKGRVVYTATQKDTHISICHECGGGTAFHYTDLFLGCECTLMDNQSSKVTGKVANQFIDYCLESNYLPEKVLNRIKGGKQ